MSTTVTTDMLADVDRMDAKAFASYLSEDCVLRFANADEVVGRDAIEAAIAGFFGTIKGISHHDRRRVGRRRHDDRPVRIHLHADGRPPGHGARRHDLSPRRR